MTWRLLLEQKGATVVELIVAASLLALVIVALAGSSMYTSKLLTRSKGQLGSDQLVQRELERLLALPYDSLATGSRTLPEGNASWTVQDFNRYREILLITAYTPTDRIVVHDTVVAYRLRP